MKAKATTDHETIKRWVEQRDGRPARVIATGSETSSQVLHIEFSDDDGHPAVEGIDWDTFFDTFEDNDLAFLYQDDSRYNRFVSRDSVELDSSRGPAVTPP